MSVEGGVPMDSEGGKKRGTRGSGKPSPLDSGWRAPPDLGAAMEDSKRPCRDAARALLHGYASRQSGDRQHRVFQISLERLKELGAGSPVDDTMVA
jgi:hypothetical protein